MRLKQQAASLRAAACLIAVSEAIAFELSFGEETALCHQGFKASGDEAARIEDCGFRPCSAVPKGPRHRSAFDTPFENIVFERLQDSYFLVSKTMKLNDKASLDNVGL